MGRSHFFFFFFFTTEGRSSHVAAAIVIPLVIIAIAVVVILIIVGIVSLKMKKSGAFDFQQLGQSELEEEDLKNFLETESGSLPTTKSGIIENNGTSNENSKVNLESVNLDEEDNDSSEVDPGGGGQKGQLPPSPFQHLVTLFCVAGLQTV